MWYKDIISFHMNSQLCQIFFSKQTITTYLVKNGSLPYVLFLFIVGCCFLIISSLLLIYLFLWKYHIHLATVQREDPMDVQEEQVKYKGSQIRTNTSPGN